MLFRLIVLCLVSGFFAPSLLTGQITIFTNAGRTYNNTDAVTIDLFIGIDISNCSTVDFSFDYNFSDDWTGSGNMESADECGAFGDPCLGDINMPSAGGCSTCWDFLYGAFSVDGGVVYEDIIGDAGTTDAEQSGSIRYRYCNSGGASSASIDIRTQTWAAAESVTFSNVSVICYNVEPSAAAAPDPVCEGASVMLNGSFGDASLVSSVTWTGPGTITNPSAINTTATNLPAGTAVFTLTATDTQGCPTTSDVSVEVNPAPIATPPPPIDICFSLSPLAGEILNLAEIEDAISNFDPSLTVNWWTNAAGTSPINFNNQAAVLTFLLGLPTTVYASVTDGTCESAVIPVSLNLSSYPTADDATLTACIGSAGVAVFTPSDADGDVTGGDGSLIVSYHTTLVLAQNDQNPITGIVTTPSDLTIFARVSNSTGCVTYAEVLLDVTNGISASNASLSACAGPSGQAVFNLTDADADVLNGATGSVEYFINAGATIPVPNPNNFLSGNATVYAVIDDGSGCPSTIAQVQLSVDPAIVATNTQLNACDNGSNQASFDLTDADDDVLNGQFGNVEYYTNPGATIPVFDPTNFVSSGQTVYAIIDDGSGCLSTIAAITLVVDPAITAFNATLNACETAFGQATFDLTDADVDVLNGQLGNVDYFLNPAATTPVGNPNNFLSGNTTVYAVIDDGSGCPSTIAAVTLIVDPAITAFNASLNACETASGQATFDLTNADVDVLNGQLGNVAYFLNPAATTLIGNPNNFLSGNTTVYAVIDDGSGCPSTIAAITVTVNPLPTLNLSIVQNIDCNGNSTGSITTNATGAMPLTYDWSNNLYDGLATLTNLGAGNYAVTVTDGNNCSAADDITLSDPAPLELICNANMPGQGSGVGSYSFTFSGGTAPYSLILGGTLNQSFMENVAGTWNTPPLPSGDYTFTISDANGCSRNCSFTINPNCDLTIGVTNTAPTCNGNSDGTITLTINSSASISNIDWNDDTLDGNAAPTGLSAGSYSVTVTDQNGCTQTRNIVLTNPAAFSLSCTATMQPSGPTANDGSIQVVINDGPAGPYTATYNNGAGLVGAMADLGSGTFGQTGLPSGTYTITVSNGNGCEASCSVTLSASACTLTLSQTGTTPTCHDSANGTITSIPTSGDGNYSFDWSLDAFDGQNTVTGRNPGDVFSVTVTDGAGCVGMETFTVPGPTAVAVNCAATTHPTAVGGSNGAVDVAIAGGTAPYAITWSGAGMGSGSLMAAGSFVASGLSAGSYTLTVTDANGCTETCGFTLTDPGCDLVLDLQGTNPVCANSTTGSLLLTIDTQLPVVSIEWNNNTFNGQTNISAVGAGIYSVTVTATGGCVASTDITVVDPPAIAISCFDTTNPSSATATDGSANINVVGGFPPYTISWVGDVSGTATMMSPGNFPISGLSVGAYSVEIMDSRGCMQFCGFVLVNGSCTFPILFLTQDESCVGTNDGSVTVVASGGTPDYSFLWSNMAATASVNGLAPGIYSVTVTDGAGCVAVGRDTVLAGRPLPTVMIGTGGDICADECRQIPLTFSGEAPFVLDYEVVSNGTTFPIQQTFNNSQDTLLFCPAILSLPVGPILIRWVNLADAQCSRLLDVTSDFNYLPNLQSDLSPTLCPGESLLVGSTLFDAGNANGQVLLTAANGCDSLVNVSLSFYPPSTFAATGTLCAGDTLTFGGQSFYLGNSTGMVTLPNASSTGCDSLIMVNLTELASATTLLTPTLCAGDTLIIAGEAFTIARPSGDILLPGAAANGCDSLIVVNVDVLPVAMETFTASICAGDSVLVGGQYFHEGFLSSTLILENAAANGCDSVIVVNVDVLPVAMETFAASICAGDSVLVGGQYFHEDFLSSTLVLENAAANGCDSVLQVTVTLLPSFVTDISTTLCPGESIQVGDIFIAEAGIYEIFLLSNEGCDSLVNVNLQYFPPADGMFETTLCAGESLTIGNQTFDQNNPTGLVNFPAGSVNGCDSTLLVSVLFLPSSAATLDTTLCFGESLTIGNQTFHAANPSGIALLEGMAANGCDSTLFVTTTYRPALTATMGPDVQLCAGQTAQGQLTLAEGDVYTLSVSASNGGQFPFAGIPGGDYAFDIPALNSNTTLTLLAVTSASGCPVVIADNNTMYEVGNPQLNLQSILNGPNGEGVSCAGLSDGGIRAVATGGIAPFSYLWNDGAVTDVRNNLPAGTYSLTATDAAGCTASASIVLNAPAPLEVVATGQSAGCAGTNTGALTIRNIIGGTEPYEYSLDDLFFSSVGDFPAVIPDLASGSYTLSIQDANDCPTSLTVVVPEGRTLVMNLGMDRTIQAGDSVLITPQLDFTPVAWTWTPREGLRDPDSLATYAAPLNTTLYQLQATDAQGCTATDMIRIIVERNVNVYIPTAFSPNGDANNSVFMIFAGRGVERVTLFQIFDRWGNQVFNKADFAPNDPQYGWDGTLNGRDMNPAVFVYFAQILLDTGELTTLKGEVVLLR